MLVGGHTSQEYELEFAKNILRQRAAMGDLVVDDETQHLAKIDFLTEQSSVTVWPLIAGG